MNDIFGEKYRIPQDDEKNTARISIEGSMGVIKIPLSEVHALRVALNPCPCRAAKSTATECIRQRLSYALAKLQGLMAGNRDQAGP